MYDPKTICLLDDAPDARVVHVVDNAASIAAWLGPAEKYVRENGFGGRTGEVALVPGESGVDSAVIVVSSEHRHDPLAFAALATTLPPGPWRLSFDGYDASRVALLAHDAVLGFCMEAYAYRVGTREAAPVRLVLPDGTDDAVTMARAIWLGRDLINMPANHLGPAELASLARDALAPFGAETSILTGAAVTAAYPCLAAVGAGSDRSAHVVMSRWQGSGATADAPLISLVGKGVCFDTGGYDIKPSAGMLRMKKDMGGAALMLAVAMVAMARDLPVRLELRLGCVENSISGHAMRPGDVLSTRAGLNVEIGNTDAEGRLVLCDLLTEACEASPDLLLDAATLTGAARVALGPDLPALFGTDDLVCEMLLEAGRVVGDDLWRLPLWYGYDAWLDRKIADIGNVAEKPMAGAITAALFLRRFVKPQINWAHIDTYAWNDASRPGRPAGGETLALRAISQFLLRFIK
ncbi:leucyl aminopeptidase [Neoasaia chiangmaiensis]|uniref:Leucyl aminopeptidase n=1 Tax=Neoasaia chiangmaiensis TaxID=320497 RepID=A0A1U9KMU5_9PROT|nr:leucyl aminopeptidase family protein [Neoasaia chiangmaiensis]AQS87121.1 leucyl aminopeptidase [Neoasaia chiangmaiensis]GEN16042.1 leucyl aminopeptidase [Neoasaia chiangmaiensis]